MECVSGTELLIKVFCPIKFCRYRVDGGRHQLSGGCAAPSLTHLWWTGDFRSTARFDNQRTRCNEAGNVSIPKFA